MAPSIVDINVGAAPDDNTGDTLRAGGIKINSNFDAVVLNYGHQSISLTHPTEFPIAADNPPGGGGSMDAFEPDPVNTRHRYIKVVASSGNHRIKLPAAVHWQTGEAVQIGDRRLSDTPKREYRATSAGTTGATPPTGTGGSINDGAVTWTYVKDSTAFAGMLVHVERTTGLGDATNTEIYGYGLDGRSRITLDVDETSIGAVLTETGTAAVWKWEFAYGGIRNRAALRKHLVKDSTGVTAVPTDQVLLYDSADVYKGIGVLGLGQLSGASGLDAAARIITNYVSGRDVVTGNYTIVGADKGRVKWFTGTTSSTWTIPNIGSAAGEAATVTIVHVGTANIVLSASGTAFVGPTTLGPPAGGQVNIYSLVWAGNTGTVAVVGPIDTSGFLLKAGGTMTGDLNMGNNDILGVLSLTMAGALQMTDFELLRPLLRDYAEKIPTPPTITAGALTLDYSAGNWQGPISHNANVTTFTISNAAASGVGASLLMEVTQSGAGPFTWAWGASVDWGDEGAPDLSGLGNADSWVAHFIKSASTWKANLAWMKSV